MRQQGSDDIGEIQMKAKLNIKWKGAEQGLSDTEEEREEISGTFVKLLLKLSLQPEYKGVWQWEGSCFGSVSLRSN